jgi:hypothetical protein
VTHHSDNLKTSQQSGARDSYRTTEIEIPEAAGLLGNV